MVTFEGNFSYELKGGESLRWFGFWTYAKGRQQMHQSRGVVGW